MSRHVQLLGRIMGAQRRPPQRILRREAQRLHPLLQVVQVAKLPANGGHHLSGLIGMEIVASHSPTIEGVCSGDSRQADEVAGYSSPKQG